ncbi:KDP operon transcriptional regulatory protein KdpE [Anatilimnocola aggregata]|uniref:KDP operon transcriptional regulatory protein KdpE n=1 Tax=Anatilimnocola aggregata TaxID=2528021 RepID=A0A517YLU8_9BACT|nr:response regulator [Anatilimnocola aggregata]QDU31190.1 KDP operon transcriptional regulatory protein KdpE [Anatilimnocola aggregata]
MNRSYPESSRPDSTQPSVLLVEPSSEAREVLATILQLRGLRIFEADEPRHGLVIARAERPDVIVLDFDQPCVDDGVQNDFAAETRHPNTGLIVLGNSPPHRQAQTDRFVAKPFHYGPLVQAIERLAGNKAA